MKQLKISLFIFGGGGDIEIRALKGKTISTNLDALVLLIFNSFAFVFITDTRWFRDTPIHDNVCATMSFFFDVSSKNIHSLFFAFHFVTFCFVWIIFFLMKWKRNNILWWRFQLETIYIIYAWARALIIYRTKQPSYEWNWNELKWVIRVL